MNLEAICNKLKTIPIIKWKRTPNPYPIQKIISSSGSGQTVYTADYKGTKITITQNYTWTTESRPESDLQAADRWESYNYSYILEVKNGDNVARLARPDQYNAIHHFFDEYLERNVKYRIRDRLRNKETRENIRKRTREERRIKAEENQIKLW